MILQAIESGCLLDVLSDTSHLEQVVLAVDIGGYLHAVPCEFRGSDLRMITAFPSRKLQKIDHQ
jgi:hypothetical protein